MPAVTRSQTKPTDHFSKWFCCEQCGSNKNLCEDEDDERGGFLLCAECAKHIMETKLNSKLVQIKIQMEFGIPTTSPYIGEIEDWLFEVVQYPCVPFSGDEGLGCGQWISDLTPLTHQKMLEFVGIKN